jgi:hypothetical protein
MSAMNLPADRHRWAQVWLGGHGLRRVLGRRRGDTVPFRLDPMARAIAIEI